jgi:hypothetical protein
MSDGIARMTGAHAGGSLRLVNRLAVNIALGVTKRIENRWETISAAVHA